MLKITRCEGEGQGSCKRCSDKGKWNRNWMCFLYRIEGYDGCYCSSCVKEIEEAEMMEKGILHIENKYKPIFNMDINLYELFFREDHKYGKDEKPDPDMIHYTRLQRVKKILKILSKNLWCNEDSAVYLYKWLQEYLVIAKDRKDKKSLNLIQKAIQEVEKWQIVKY